MARHRTSPEATPILQLLSDYSFDVEAHGTEAMVTDWLQRFEPVWVSQAITEALYQGRYKMVSVDHILQIWQRRGQPLRHFNREFESIILGQSLSQIPSPAKESPAPLNFSQEIVSRGSVSLEIVNRESVSPESGIPDSGIPDSGSPESLRQDNTGGRGGTPLTFAEWSHPVAAEREDQAPLGTPRPDQSADPCPDPWWSSRTIPPLTPDQLARLTKPLTPAVPAPITSAPVENTEDTEDTPSEAIPTASRPDDADSEAPGALADLTPADSLLGATDSTAAVSADDHPEDVPSELGIQAETATEISLDGQPIPNFQPIFPRPMASSEPADTIPPFVPTPGPSDLHQRLKAVVEAGRQES